MTVRDFLDAAYVLLFREVRPRFDSLEEALETLAPLAARTIDHSGDAEARAAEARERRENRRQEQAQRQVEAMLARAGAPAIR